MHTPLDLEREQIRLVRLEDWSQDYELRCSIEVFDRARCPAYVAVSYVWGTDAPSIKLRANGKFMLLRHNLASFLRVITNNKLCIRGPDHEIPYRPLFLWIDQICIDQDSVAERNHQVQLMGAIYRHAERVVSWLGSGIPNSDDAIEFMATHTAVTRQNAQVAKSSSMDMGVQRPQDAQLSRAILGLKHIFTCEYWHRLWIAQEFILGKELLIACNEHAIDWVDLSRFEEIFGGNQMSLGVYARMGRHIPGSASNHFHFRRQREESGGVAAMSLKSVLSLLTYLECRDVRDKVYGLLGLTSSELKVDYVRHPAEVFWQAIEALDQPPTGRDVHTLFELGILMSVQPSAFREHGYGHDYESCSLCAHSNMPAIRSMWKEMDLDPHWSRDRTSRTRRCDVEYCERCLGNIKPL